MVWKRRRGKKKFRRNIITKLWVAFTTSKHVVVVWPADYKPGGDPNAGVTLQVLPPTYRVRRSDIENRRGGDDGEWVVGRVERFISGPRR